MRLLITFIIFMLLAASMGCGVKTKPPTSESVAPPAVSESPGQTPDVSSSPPLSQATSHIETASPGAKESGPDGVKEAEAIDFTLKDTAGSDASISSYKGKKTVLLVFWATWCPHCRAEIPTLKKLHDEFKGKEFEILAIDVMESKKKVVSFLEKNDIKYRVLLDESGAVARSYGVLGIPTIVFIDKKGNIVYVEHELPQDLSAFVRNLL